MWRRGDKIPFCALEHQTLSHFGKSVRKRGGSLWLFVFWCLRFWCNLRWCFCSAYFVHLLVSSDCASSKLLWVSCTFSPTLCNSIKKCIKPCWLLAAGFHEFLRPKCLLLLHKFCLGKESGHLGFVHHLSRPAQKKKLNKSSGSQWSCFFLWQ